MSKLNEFLLADAANTVLGSTDGYVGVGWVFNEKTFDFVCPREDGSTHDGNIHPPFNHRQRFEHEVLRHAPTLRGKTTYTSLPRYRVYWAKTHSVVVGWELLMDKHKFREHINKIYHLVNPVFTTEDHYNGLDWGPSVLEAMETLKHWK